MWGVGVGACVGVWASGRHRESYSNSRGRNYIIWLTVWLYVPMTCIGEMASPRSAISRYCSRYTTHMHSFSTGDEDESEERGDNRAPPKKVGKRQRTQIMTFESDGEIRQNAKLYGHPDVAMQRRRLIEIARPRKGERCLDVGCGQGFLLMGLVHAVGEMGEVYGIDISMGMLVAARSRCPSAQLQRASATALPFKNATFDLVVVCQVLVYVQDPQRTISEMVRVLRPGGRLVVLDSVWSHAFWNVRDLDRQRRVLREFDKHARHPTLPMRVPLMMKQAGLRFKETRAVPIVGTSWDTSWGSMVAVVIADYVHRRGLLHEKDTNGWLDDMKKRADEGEFFFNINRYVYLGFL